MCLSSESVTGVVPQLLEESSGRTAYQPSVRILKRDRAADSATSSNQLVGYVITVNISDICDFGYWKPTLVHSVA